MTSLSLEERVARLEALAASQLEATERLIQAVASLSSTLPDAPPRAAVPSQPPAVEAESPAAAAATSAVATTAEKRPGRRSPSPPQSPDVSASPAIVASFAAPQAAAAGDQEDLLHQEVEAAHPFWQAVAGCPFVPPRGVFEDHPLVAVMDVLYVIVAAIACVAAVFSIHDHIIVTSGGAAAASADGGDLIIGISDYTVVMDLWAFFLVHSVTYAWIFTRLFVSVKVDAWRIEDDLIAIRAHYVRHWLFYDLTYSFPLEFILAPWAPNFFYISCLRHLLRFGRIMKLGESGNPLLQERRWFRFIGLSAFMLVLITWFAIIFWTFEPQAALGDAFYWAFATVSTVGYGDVSAQSRGGRNFSIIAIVVSIVFMSITTASVTAFVTYRDPLTEEAERRKLTMHAMLEHFQVPWNVQKEVIAMFPAALRVQVENDFRKLFEDMPKALADRLDGYARAAVIRKFHIFRNANEAVLLEVVTYLRRVYFQTNEIIFTVGAEGEEMYFVMSGVVSISRPQTEEELRAEELEHRKGATISGGLKGIMFAGSREAKLTGGRGKVVATIKRGGHFGEAAIFTNKVYLRSRNATAASMCELVILRRQDFLTVVRKHRDLANSVATDFDAAMERDQQQEGHTTADA